MLSLACPNDDFERELDSAEIPAGAVSAAATVIVPQGNWTLRIETQGRWEISVREPSKSVEELEQTCLGACFFRDHELRCPRGRCTFVFDLVALAGANWVPPLRAGIRLREEPNEGCGAPDPDYVPSEDIGSLFQVTFDVHDVVLAPDGGMDGTRGTLIDARDGKRYVTVTIGNQVWMAQGLNYGELQPGVGVSMPLPDDGKMEKYCLADDPDRCSARGGSYTWPEALALPAACMQTVCAAQVASPHQGICPDGWHIPSHADWSELASYVARKRTDVLGENDAWRGGSTRAQSHDWLGRGGRGHR